jgi:thymidylate synthase
LGELLWYLSKRNDLEFITYYISKYEDESEDKAPIHGAYGPRIFDSAGHDQLENAILLLTQWPSSRRAVIQIFEAQDISKKRKEVPCTCTLQFLIRQNKLLMFTYMRSNDAYMGLPHDIYAFTMLQEIAARRLNVEVGAYHHLVGSLHLYEGDEEKIKLYLSEGLQDRRAMPKMPPGDPAEAIVILLKAEELIRTGKPLPVDFETGLASYWKDLILLLKIYRAGKDDDQEAIELLKEKISHGYYGTYVADKILNVERVARNNAARAESQFSLGL